MKYYIIAGEASGDLHGANLMRGLKECDSEASFRFWGGDRMVEAGGGENLVKHYKSTSFFGLVEVLRNLPTILSQIDFCKSDINNFAPDVLILIDYPGFNLKVARYAHSKRIKTFYYISPKVWAWKESRVKQLRRYVDKLFIIFPFETEYFRRRGIEAVYEGNPICDVIEQTLASLPSREEFLAANALPSKPMVALLAGSRKTEIRNNLPFMVELSKRFPDYQFVVAGVSWLDRAIYDRILCGSDVKFVCDATYPVVKHSLAAVVTSGTATLETALIGTPEVVCYKADELSMRIGRMLVKIPFISLVNIIMKRETVRELIQWDMTIDNAVEELNAILPGGSKRERMLADFAELSRMMGEAGTSLRVACRMVGLLNER